MVQSCGIDRIENDLKKGQFCEFYFGNGRKLAKKWNNCIFSLCIAQNTLNDL
jgi:hypothetical protein